jgi:hypothetical protein
MTPSEFKAWFDGFTEAFSGVPTKAQWTRIKERVGEIDGKPVTERVYVDRWWPHVGPYIYTQPIFTYPTYCGSGIGIGTSSASFDSCSAMNMVGRAEAYALTAA